MSKRGRVETPLGVPTAEISTWEWKRLRPTNYAATRSSANGFTLSYIRSETLFWEWTKRSDIQAQLYPHRDPDKARRDVVCMLDRELLGIRNGDGLRDEPEIDPALLI